ncbi:GNAT family N-acetyltransferase [Brevibacillus gelatini]|uniref:GNAT family N-acetyltransferase n=1 Tax=Brevibacillus gelatini TaxID=1655277 RepID=UPI003D812F58
MSLLEYEIVTTKSMSAAQLEEVSQLAVICNEHDGIDLKINPSMLEKRSGDHPEDFLCYVDNKLVGFLGLYVFHNKEAEVSGMVHPAHRRKGIFTGLQRVAEEECRKRGIPDLVFIVQKKAQSGAAYMQRIGARYEFSEYWMDLEKPAQVALGHAVQLRPATAADDETLIQLNVLGFKLEEAMVREMAERMANDPLNSTYLILAEEREVGKISVNREGQKAFIYGFCVHPDEQGKGYGRQALAKTIELIQAEGFTDVSLEVACENNRALGLYESCGFVVKSANDYYRLAL